MLVTEIWRSRRAKIFSAAVDQQRFHASSTGFPHGPVSGHYTSRMTVWRAIALALVLPALAYAQGVPPLYRVFLSDGSTLSSYGEWARVDDRIVFSMPVTPGAEPGQLHLVSLPAASVDWTRTERYADAVRAAHYGASRGEEDFARLSADVAEALNEVALLKDPTDRLVRAERARRALADWPSRHFGYRAKEVHDILGSLDEVIGGLRAAAGLGRYDLALMATTTPPPTEMLMPPPDQAAVVQQLMTAAALVDTPEEKVSLFQTVVGILDRAVGLLPEGWAATIRATALGAIAEERKIDESYRRLRETTVLAASRYASEADVRNLERLRTMVDAEDRKLGRRRLAEVMAMTAALEAHLEAAHRLRLARDQWQLRVHRVRAYQRETSAPVEAIARQRSRLDDIRTFAGPEPWRLRPLVELLGRQSRILSRMDVPPELETIHALFRSASDMAHNAAQLRLDAVEAADLDLARRASSAAAGAMMLLARARAELEAALRPPVAPAAAQ